MQQLFELLKQKLSPNNIIVSLKTLPTYQEKQDWLMKKDLAEYIKNDIFFIASEEGDLDIVKILVECQGVNPATHNNHALLVATLKGHLEVVKFLATLPNVDPKALNASLCLAAPNEKLEIVKFLVNLPNVDPTAWDNYAFRCAAKKGNTEAVKFLAHSFYNPFKFGLPSKEKDQHLQLLDCLPKEEKKELMKSLLIAVNQNCIHLFFSNPRLPVSKDVERFIAKTTIDYDLQMTVKSN